jgi:regulator of protease activity HflC (stomatin/prohibitin superfamily)
MKQERAISTAPGGGMIVLVLILYAAFVALFILGAVGGDLPMLLIGIGLGLVAILATIGFFIINPNEAAVLLLFGKYKGTSHANGFRWTNPFMTKRKVSLRARNLNGDRLKVNDKSANPIEIAAVVVWRVKDTFKALFEVDDYEDYVRIQSESALRHLASSYPYDGDGDELSLRGSTDEINEHLRTEISERLDLAGIQVIEARFSHMAYAPEIASAMLQRQQAAAVVQARRLIVDGAVGMVEMALDRLKAQEVIHLDEDKKATMVSNLLVVLCSEKAAQPVVNTGTLYQ